MNEQLWFHWKAEVDNDVKHRNINTTRRQVSYHKNASQTVAELCDRDLARRRIKSTV